MVAGTSNERTLAEFIGEDINVEKIFKHLFVFVNFHVFFFKVQHSLKVIFHLGEETNPFEIMSIFILSVYRPSNFSTRFTHRVKISHFKIKIVNLETRRGVFSVFYQMYNRGSDAPMQVQNKKRLNNRPVVTNNRINDDNSLHEK